MTIEPGAAGAPKVRSAWGPVWLSLCAIGVLALVGAGAVLLVTRTSGTAGGGGAVALGVLLGGAAALCIAGNAFLLGVGMGGRPLRPGTHRAVGLSVLLALALAILALGSFIALDRGAIEDMAHLFALGAVALYGALGVTLYLHGVRAGGMSAESLGISFEGFAAGPLWGGGAALGVLLVSAANGLAMRGLGLANPQVDSFRWLSGRQPHEYVLAGIGVVVVAPIVEELFFRGYVFNAYLGEKGPRTAYVGSALAFALTHGLPTLFFGLFGMGLVLAYAYRRAGTIVAPIIAHALNNAIAFAALLSAARG